MFRKHLAFLIATSFLYSEPFTFPETIDFSRFTATMENPEVEPISWNMGYYAFNFAPEISPLFALLKRTYQLEAVIETGTYAGSTTVFFSLLFDEVHTIEIREDLYAKAKDRLLDCSNVQCHLGTSPIVLAEILPSLQSKRVLIYLDAHGSGDSPFIDELEAIGVSHKDNCILVIDDFAVPGRNEIPYDPGLLIENIKNDLGSVFSQYTLHYLIPKSVKSRAKLIVIPKQWQS